MVIYNGYEHIHISTALYRASYILNMHAFVLCSCDFQETEKQTVRQTRVSGKTDKWLPRLRHVVGHVPCAVRFNIDEPRKAI